MSAEWAGAVNRKSRELVFRVFERHSGGLQPENKYCPVFDFDGRHTSRNAKCSQSAALVSRIKDVYVFVVVLKKITNFIFFLKKVSNTNKFIFFFDALLPPGGCCSWTQKKPDS